MSRKKQARVARSTKEKELDIKQDGLRLRWIIFLDEYIKNGGNGQEAYKKAYPDIKNDETARVNASRLLTNATVKAELYNKLEAQKITEDRITGFALNFIELGLSSEKYAMAGAKMVEMLGKVKGMLVDTKRIAFTGENPAIFKSLYTEKDKKDFDKIKESGDRITE